MHRQTLLLHLLQCGESAVVVTLAGRLGKRVESAVGNTK
jgi:hypothetical protein